MTARHVFLLSALIPLSLIAVALVVREERGGEAQVDVEEVKGNVRKVCESEGGGEEE